MKKFKPTKQQEKFIEAVDWFIEESPRAVGRTTLVAWRYIECAMKRPGIKFYLQDFGQHSHEYSSRDRFAYQVIDMISKLEPELRSRFKFDKSNFSIKFLK